MPIRTRHLLCVLTWVFAAASTSTSRAGALDLGEPPPPIDLPDRDGRQIDLESLAGSVVIVDFWASWCEPCKREMPVLQGLYERYASRGLVVIGVNVDRSTKKLEGFLRKTPVTFRVAHDRELEVASRYELSTMPSTFFVGRDGKLRFMHEGFQNQDAKTMDEWVRTLLGEGTGSPPKTHSKSNACATKRAVFAAADPTSANCAVGCVSCRE